MRNRTISTRIAPLALLAFGCGSSDPSSGSANDVAAVQQALAQPNGGMSATNEPPAFGDPEVASLEEFTTDFANPGPANVAAAARTTRSYHVMLLWGHMRPAGDASAPPKATRIDWTGSVSVDSGAVGVLRTLAFDRNDGVEAQTSARVVSFVSHTLPAVDGLLVRVVVPAGAARTLHFETQALTSDISLAPRELDKGGLLPLAHVPAGGLAWIGYQDDPGCAQGFTFGHWTSLGPDLGTIRWRVMDGDGETIGHARGIWGQPSAFFGKYIGLDGHYGGLFEGDYASDRSAGLWDVLEPASAGAVSVVYSGGSEKGGDEWGPAIGRWSLGCRAK